MGFALHVEREMRQMQCGECGIEFTAPEHYMAEKQKNGTGWYCPNGHARVYKESDVDKLKKLLEAERQRANLEAASRRTAEEAQRKAEAEAKRLKKRVQAGVCPCCNRTFQNLARHMATKHKD